MSVACASRLQRSLNRAMAWRRRELVAVYLGMPDDSASAHVYTRQATLLLYAHVEGFVKYAAVQYLKAIKDEGAQTSSLCDALLGLALRSSVNHALGQDSMAVIGQMVTRAIANPASLPPLPVKDVVKTRANLSGKRLRKILATIGLDSVRFEAQEKDVIDRVLKWRNAIAHGEGIPVDRDDYRRMHHLVIDLMDDLKTYLEDCAATDEYLR